MCGSDMPAPLGVVSGLANGPVDLCSEQPAEQGVVPPGAAERNLRQAYVEGGASEIVNHLSIYHSVISLNILLQIARRHSA